jgi:protein CpxP
MKKTNIAILIIAILGIGAIFAIAQTSGRKHGGGKGSHFGGMHKMDRGGGMGMALKGLDLTDEQKANVKAIMDAHHTAMKPAHEAMKENRQKMQAATANGAFDEAAVTEIANAGAGLMAYMKVEKARVKSQVFSILTDEQKAKASEMKSKWGEGKRGFRGRKGPKAEQVEQN